MREDTGPQPSARAAERLAADVGAEVADLRGSLRRALAEADRLQADGRSDLAAAVLEDQREALAAVHQQLSERLAAAAVEREAEHILDVAASEPVQGHAAAASAPVWDTTVVRLVASAAAAVAGLALLFAPDLGPGMLEAAGFGGSGDTAPAASTPDALTPTAENASHDTPAAEPPGASQATSGAASPAPADRAGDTAQGGALPATPPPAPPADEDASPGSVEDLTEDLLVPLVDGARVVERPEGEGAEGADGEAAGDDTRDAPWDDVDLDGSSAE